RGSERRRMIDLYTAPTPNGWKVSILLEELSAARQSCRRRPLRCARTPGSGGGRCGSGGRCRRASLHPSARGSRRTSRTSGAPGGRPSPYRSGWGWRARWKRRGAWRPRGGRAPEAERGVVPPRGQRRRLRGEVAAANQYLRAHAEAPGGVPARAGVLEVDEGYERALAAALDGRLGAALVDDLAEGERVLQ